MTYYKNPHRRAGSIPLIDQSSHDISWSVSTMSGYSHIPPRHGQTSSHSNDGRDYGPDPPSRYTSSRGHPYTEDMGAPSSLPRNSKSWGGARGGAYGSEQGRYERDMRNVRGDGHNRGDREDP